MRIWPVWSRLGPELVLRLSGSTVSVRTVPPGLGWSLAVEKGRPPAALTGARRLVARGGTGAALRVVSG
jgi:hypothetical protein